MKASRRISFHCFDRPLTCSARLRGSKNRPRWSLAMMGRLVLKLMYWASSSWLMTMGLLPCR